MWQRESYVDLNQKVCVIHRYVQFLISLPVRVKYDVQNLRKILLDNVEEYLQAGAWFQQEYWQTTT